MKTNIALIGFMGVGKSAVGKVLAERLGKTLVDIDFLVVQKTGKSIPHIFREEGESAFRKLESEIIEGIAIGNNQVIACGGGLVLQKSNVDVLKRGSIIIWLIASPEVISRRTTLDGDGRPLLQGKNTVADIRHLLLRRQPFYESAADIKIDTTDLKIASLTEQILLELKKNADFSSQE